MKTYTIGQFNECFPPVIDGVSLTVHNYARLLNRTMGNAYVITPSFHRCTIIDRKSTRLNSSHT